MTKEEEHNFEITEEDKEIMRNATTEKCPDCGCENVERLEPISTPDGDVLCECKNKQCQFTWAVPPDPTKVFSTPQDKDCYIVFRRDLDYAVWMFRNKREYNRITKLNATAIYYSKLLSQYGFNAKTGEWNLKQFPVTQTSTQMERIRNDYDSYINAVTNFNEYSQYLAGKYDLDLDELKQYNLCLYTMENMWV